MARINGCCSKDNLLRVLQAAWGLLPYIAAVLPWAVRAGTGTPADMCCSQTRHSALAGFATQLLGRILLLIC